MDCSVKRQKQTAGVEQRMTNEIETRLTVAKAIAHEAGQLARRRFLDNKRSAFSFKGHQDYLTETDGEVERFIAAALARAFPGDAFIGEEGGGEAGENTWIIDPIDGTSNFARGIPHFCVSIGFLRAGRPEVGVIYAPMLDELYAARTGGGATLNGLPIKVSDTSRLDHAVIEMGWSPRRPVSRYISAVETAISSGISVRRSGSGALGIAYAAAGRIDGYCEIHINSWDVAAGVVIADEAGARLSDFFSGDAIRDGNPILVASPGIAEALSSAVGIALA